MNEVRNEELVRLSMRRELTPEEASRLEAHLAGAPGARLAWEEERALSRAVQALPDVPVASNFTARVLQSLEAEQARDGRRSRSPDRGWLRRPLPRFGWAVAVLLLGLFGAQQIRTVKEARFAENISLAAADLAKVPNPEVVLQDFEAIRQMGQVSAVSAGSDDELLRALQ